MFVCASLWVGVCVCKEPLSCCPLTFWWEFSLFSAPVCTILPYCSVTFTPVTCLYVWRTFNWQQHRVNVGTWPNGCENVWLIWSFRGLHVILKIRESNTRRQRKQILFLQLSASCCSSHSVFLPLWLTNHCRCAAHWEQVKVWIRRGEGQKTTPTAQHTLVHVYQL